jgi:electron transfer flavoprotein alpha subunit
MFSARNLFSKTVRSRSSISGVRRAVSGSHRNASSLVVAEHSEGTLSAGSLVTITAASQLGGNVDVLLMGSASGGSNASGVAGVSKILCMENSFLDHGLAEDTASALTAFLKANGDYTHILAPSTNHGKNYIPRAAALMDSAPLSDITEVISEDTFKRPMYAGNANATVTMSDTKKFLLVRTTAFEKAETSGGSATVEKVEMGDGDIQAAMSTFVSASAKQSGRPDLSAAGVVVSGGRGMKNGENFGMLEEMADKLGGAVGASRAAVDAGYVPNELQVGQTGKVVAPDLYIAVGISGAIQHLSGMKDSKTIVAINKDKDAPIFQVADYGLEDDLFKAVPEINSKI